MITVRNATFSYLAQSDDDPALRDVSCDIERGDFVGVTGPTDAGKSTFCRLLAGHVPHFFDGELDGSVVVDGVETADSDISQLSQTVGFVFQDPFDQLSGTATSVFEEVAFGLENRGVPASEIRDRIHEALERVGIADLAERDPNNLSGGQSQRLAVASVLAMQPDVLVLDEPTSQLDPEGTRAVIQTLADLSDDYTVVVATQNLAAVSEHVDQLVILSEGEIALNGSPREVLSERETVSELVRTPESVRMGTRLEAAGLLDEDAPLPIHEAEVVEALRPHVRAADIDSPGGDDSAAGASSGDPTLDVTDLTHRYDSGVEALRDVSLSVSSGCVCLLGQNGAGKSTFVKHLNGLLDPTSGKVIVAGRDTRDHRVAQLASDVGLCFQNPNDQLFRETVEAELRFGPENLGYDDDRIDRLVERAVSRLELEAVRTENPYDIGLPLRKRVAVASVVAMDPEIVVLDEPTSGQDADGRAVLGRAIDELVADDTVVVVVTHDVEFARAHADRIVVLGDGEVLLDGSPSDVFGNPDVLRQTNVRPPAVTRVADRLGLTETVLTVDELLEAVAESKPLDVSP